MHRIRGEGTLMRKLAWLVVVGSALASRAFGQSSCADEMDRRRTCKYDFSVTADGYLPDWQETTPPGLNHMSVANRIGRINVLAGGGAYYTDNNAHFLWDFAGGGFNEASATLGFVDSGKPGWLDKFSNGERYFSFCRPGTVAPRASDEMMLLTLYDDGESFVGGFVGGDTHPLGVSLIYDPDTIPPSYEWRGFAVMGLVQKLAGEAMPRVLKVVGGRPIPMGTTDLKLTVRVEDGWVRAVAESPSGGHTYEASAPLVAAPNQAGGVGLNGIVLPRPYYCIYHWGGEINRVFEVTGVNATATIRE